MSAQTVNIPFSEVGCVSVDMGDLIAKVFSVSKSQAKRLIKQNAVEVVERNRSTKEVERRETAQPIEHLLVYSQETETLLRCGKQWKGVVWQQ